MNFLVLQSLKGHMFANFKYMRAIMLKNLLQMLYPFHTELRTVPYQFESQFQNLLKLLIILFDNIRSCIKF